MSWAGDALKSLRKIILIEDKITTMAEDVKTLALLYQELSERLARMEGKFEAYERLAGSNVQPKRLPKPRR